MLHADDFRRLKASPVAVHYLFLLQDKNADNIPDFLEFSNFYRAKFHEELERFYQFTLLIMAWSIYLRRQGKRPNINNINFSRFFTIREDLTLETTEDIGKTGEIQLLERICGETTPEEWLTDVKLIMEELQELPPKTYLRGKLELGFFVKFVNALLVYLRSNLALDGGNVSTKTSLTEENAVEVLGPRLRIPSSLENFLQENLLLSTLDK